MTAKDRARMMHWDVDCKEIEERDQAGEVIAAEIDAWNMLATKAAKERAGGERLLKELRRL